MKLLMKKIMQSLILMICILQYPSTLAVIIRNENSEEVDELDIKLAKKMHYRLLQEITGLSNPPEIFENELTEKEITVNEGYAKHESEWYKIYSTLWECAAGKFNLGQRASEISGHWSESQWNCENLIENMAFLLENETDKDIKAHAQKRIEDINTNEHGPVYTMHEDLLSQAAHLNRSLNPSPLPQILEKAQEKAELRNLDETPPRRGGRHKNYEAFRNYIESKSELDGIKHFIIKIKSDNPDFVLPENYKQFIIKQEEIKLLRRLTESCLNNTHKNQEECFPLKELFKKLKTSTNNKYYNIHIDTITNRLSSLSEQ